MGYIKILILASLISTLFGCYTLSTKNKLEESHYLGLSEITRVDDGSANSKGNFRVNGYFNYELKDRDTEVFNDTEIVEFNYLIPETISYDTIYHRNINYHTNRSVGFDFSYSFNSLIGMGINFDYASKSKNTNNVISEEERYSNVLVGIYPRLTYNKEIVTIAYRPEFVLGISNIKLNNFDITPYEITLIESDQLKRFHFNFHQFGSIRVDPIEYVGIFGGVKHLYKPYIIREKDFLYRHSLVLYAGVGSQFLDLINFSIYLAKPYEFYSSKSDLPASIGFSAGINLNTKK